MDALVYTAAEAAEILRERPGSVQKKLETGEIPAYREGRIWKIPKTLLIAYMENRAMEEAKERRKLNEKVCVGSE